MSGRRSEMRADAQAASGGTSVPDARGGVLRGPSLARGMARRLALIATVLVVLNMVLVGAYYGADRRELESEVVLDQTARLGAAVRDGRIGDEARALYAAHPAAYAFALVDRAGAVIDSMNAALIPPSAKDIYADDWITRLDTPGGRLLVAGHEFADRTDGLRVVFVMADDPARLLRAALLSELRQHVWLPVLPLALVLIGAGVVSIGRGLAPVGAAAAWARAVRPGTAVPPPPPGPVPAEIADLVEATQRALDRLASALEAESRRAAEAAHALRTPVAVLVARVDALPPGETTDRLRADLAALSRTVRQVLAASRAEALEVPADGAIDLRCPAADVVGALAPLAHAQGVALSLEAPAHPVQAVANREAVELAVTNLVENAILHAGPCDVVVSVGPGPVLAVRDTGPGLPDGAGTRVLDPFWRGPDARAGGTGLGLAIVDRVARAQGGALQLRAPEGGGCEITLTLRGDPN